jgi:hypothetical protein
VLRFQRIVHADWSRDHRKRWSAEATKRDSVWSVAAPRRVGDLAEFRADLAGGLRPVIAGFDFPIGVPSFFGKATSQKGFLALFDQLGCGDWARFYDVCDYPEEVSIARPFYPRVASTTARQVHLLDRLSVDAIDQLRRASERATDARRAACSLFWTLGGNQVGKAAISGWQEVIAPARRAGASLWPFDGNLASLGKPGAVVLAETYPAEAYGHVGVHFAAGGSKRRQNDRRAATFNLLARCVDLSIVLSEELKATIEDGFGPRKSGEDPFDAVMGLLGMIEVVEGRRPEAPADIPNLRWEGWIFGRGI